MQKAKCMCHLIRKRRNWRAGRRQPNGLRTIRACRMNQGKGVKLMERDKWWVVCPEYQFYLTTLRGPNQVYCSIPGETGFHFVYNRGSTPQPWHTLQSPHFHNTPTNENFARFMLWLCALPFLLVPISLSPSPAHLCTSTDALCCCYCTISMYIDLLHLLEKTVKELQNFATMTTIGKRSTPKKYKFPKKPFSPKRHYLPKEDVKGLRAEDGEWIPWMACDDRWANHSSV